MTDEELRELDKNDILGAAIWPLWPCLPLKTRKAPEPGHLRECAILYDADSKIAKGKADKFTVYKIGFDAFTKVKDNLERLRVLQDVRVEYDSLDKLLDEWTVD